jgi:hypothetical protein
MNNMAELARAIVGGGTEPHASEHLATVLRRDQDGTYWVRIPGGADETPINTPMVEAADGDTVRVSISGGRSVMTGNVTSPVATGRTVEGVSQVATASKQTADDALNSASVANEAAEMAVSSAASAASAAVTANTAANSALAQLGTVEDVLGTVNWITEHGTYALTQDTVVDDSKVYYTRSGSGTSQDPYVYTAVAEPTTAGLPTYYELSIDAALSQYVSSHLALTNDGLYVLKDNSGYKALLSNTGMTVYDPSGTSVAQFGSTARIGTAAGQNIKIDSDSVDICTGSTVDATLHAAGASFLRGDANIAAFTYDDAFKGIAISSRDANTDIKIVNGLDDGGGNAHSGIMISKLIAWGYQDSIEEAFGINIIKAANGFSVIGDRVFSEQTSAVSMPNSTYKNIMSISITAGTWVITGGAEFAANATGIRGAAISTVSAAYDGSNFRAGGMRVNAYATYDTFINLARTIVVTVTTNIYLVGFQNSGSSLNAYGLLSAVRIK